MADWFSIIHLDRMVELTGSYNAGADETTWTLPFPDSTLDTIVLGEDFNDDAGSIISPDSNDGTGIVKAGDYSAGEVVIGRAYTMQAELTRPYVRDRNGNADIDARVTLRQLTSSHHKTAAYTLKATMDLRSDRTKSLDADPLQERGYLKAWFNGNAEDVTLYILNTTPKPCTITGLEYIVDYEPRMGMR